MVVKGIPGPTANGPKSGNGGKSIQATGRKDPAKTFGGRILGDDGKRPAALHMCQDDLTPGERAKLDALGEKDGGNREPNYVEYNCPPGREYPRESTEFGLPRTEPARGAENDGKELSALGTVKTSEVVANPVYNDGKGSC